MTPFHKSLWTLQDVDARADSEEGTYLEFKKATEFLANGRFVRDKLVDELVETASAFLNADGGVMLLGDQTLPDTSDKKVEYLKPVADWGETEALEHWEINITASQVQGTINSNLSPSPFGIQVTRIGVPMQPRDATVFVITVPPSQMGAHQSLSSHRYYRRVGDADLPMADYEIRDVNNRRSRALLYLRSAGVPNLGDKLVDVGINGVTRVQTRSAGTREKPHQDFFLVVRAMNLELMSKALSQRSY